MSLENKNKLTKKEEYKKYFFDQNYLDLSIFPVILFLYYVTLKIQPGISFQKNFFSVLFFNNLIENKKNYYSEVLLITNKSSHTNLKNRIIICNYGIEIGYTWIIISIFWGYAIRFILRMYNNVCAFLGSLILTNIEKYNQKNSTGEITNEDLEAKKEYKTRFTELLMIIPLVEFNVKNYSSGPSIFLTLLVCYIIAYEIEIVLNTFKEKFSEYFKKVDKE